MAKVSVNTNPVANGYTSRDERIIEFSHANGGGLIAFRPADDGTLIVDVYRQDATVIVRVGEPDS